MKWVAVESSLLMEVAYERGDRVLWLRLYNGRIYRYSDVPAEVYTDLLEAESKGRFFNLEIKDIYACVRV
jgi:hypothetical protein